MSSLDNDGGIVTFGPYTLHKKECNLFFQSGKDIIKSKLSIAEAQILCYLLEHCGEVCSYNELKQAGWKGRPVSSNALPVSIANLRKSLSLSGAYVEINNITRQGYLLVIANNVSEAINGQPLPELPPAEENNSIVVTQCDCNRVQEKKHVSATGSPNRIIRKNGYRRIAIRFLVLLFSKVQKHKIKLYCLICVMFSSMYYLWWYSSFFIDVACKRLSEDEYVCDVSRHGGVSQYSINVHTGKITKRIDDE